MSLNWREIDRILAEIPLEGSFIRQVHQPDHQSLVFELYNRGQSFRLYVSFAPRRARLHLLTRRLANPSRPPRFAGFLRARIRGGRILSAAQLGRERIVVIRVLRGEESLLLYARFWGGAANLLVTTPEGRILDALYRRPKKQEISGGFFRPEDMPVTAGDDTFRVRELPGEGGFNEKIERFYFDAEEQDAAARSLQAALKQAEEREARLLANLEKLKERRRDYASHEQLKKWGDLILSQAHTLGRGDAWLVCADFEDPDRTLSIELDPALGPAENAERYYRRHRKARAGLIRLEEEIRSHELALEELRGLVEALRRGERPPGENAAPPPRAARPRRPVSGDTPGLSFVSSPYRLLVGRTARENDSLLRHHVRGNDIWLHARDAPGAYVFIRTIPGKSVPLEVLLDAGNLALHYSRAKSSGRGDVYYTRVKYLRRPRGGKTGLVIPTQEKNLAIVLDPERIGRLKRSRGAEPRPGGGRP